MDTQVNSNLNNFRISDAVQEFAIQTSVSTAEFGRGTGGQVSEVTKSGTNQLHGSMFEYLRNSDLDAADFFTNKAKGTKSPLHRNQFGGTLGGPIRKNKTFIFGSFEEFRQVAPTVSLTRVPSDAERAAVTDPISRALLQFWPTANTLVGTNNFIANIGASVFDYTGLVRVDHNITDADHLTGRFIDFQGATFTPGRLPLEGGNRNTPVSRNGVLTETHVFSPKLLNEVRIGYSRNQTFITVQDAGLNAASYLQSNGQPLPGVVDGSKNVQDSGLPTVSISGGFSPLGSTTNLPKAASRTRSKSSTISRGSRRLEPASTRSASAITSAASRRGVIWIAWSADRSASLVGRISQQARSTVPASRPAARSLIGIASLGIFIGRINSRSKTISRSITDSATSILPRFSSIARTR
jgi:hypothetical protein